MAKYIIIGGKPLRGEINISGSKNAALPIMAASALSDTPSTISNVPDITDVQTMAEIINATGAKAEQVDRHTWQISGKGMSNHHLNPTLAWRLRASILAISPIIARLHKAVFPHPGGCIIGKRPVDTHLEAMRNLGVDITTDATDYIASTKKLHPNHMFLDEVSVTATENALMLAALIPGETLIRPAACEPHVVDLANFLIKMGASIRGAGTHEIYVYGVEKLSGVTHQIIPDNIEAGTFAIMAAATKGQIKILNVIFYDLDPIIHKLRQMGTTVDVANHHLVVTQKKPLVAARIQIDTWPRLPTDLQAPFGVLATQAHGTSLIHDWLFERRLAYTEELSRMGANITQCDPHRALVTGPTSLFGTNIKSLDLRAGIALVIAALVAKGKTQIDNIELIDRGYENLDERLRALGAEIRRYNGEDKKE